MKILIFDTETTGLPKNYKGSIYDSDNWPYIVQLSYILFDCNTKKILINKNDIIKLNNSIPKSSTAIHNITDDISQTQGICIKVALHNFNKYAKLAKRLVAHNISFDQKMIIVECIRNNIMSAFSQTINLYCTMKKGTTICAIEKKGKDNTSYLKYPTLSELYEKLFGTIPKGTHNAQNDILICLRCYYYLEYNVDLIDKIPLIKTIL